MKKISRRSFLKASAAAVAVAGMTACGSSDTTTSTTTSTSTSTTTSSDDTTSTAEPVKMVMALDSMMADYPGIMTAFEEIQQMDKYAHVEWEVLEADAEYNTTMPIAVAGGEQRDVMCVTSPLLQQTWANAGVIQPLDEFVASAGIDLDAEYGQYKDKGVKNDQFYIVPNVANQWVLFYNKNVFDMAGVDYPDSKVPMTWAEYKETAKMLCSGEGNDKVYGVFNMNWTGYWMAPIMTGLGGGENLYTADGLSNIEDPIVAESMQMYYDMLEVDKSAPTWADVATSKVDVNAFLNGKYGMSMHASWMWSKLVDQDTYPRDYEMGIAPIPNDNGDLCTYGSVNGFCVSSTSADPQLATEIAIDISRLFSKYTTVATAANMTYDQSDLYVAVGDALSVEGITTEDIQYLTSNPDMDYVSEKIIGPNSSNYESVVTEEAGLFFIGEQSLEDTIANIKERGDAAILG